MFFSYKKSNLIISLITFLLFCSVLFAAAYAFPQMPTNFYGYVYLGAENHTATTGTNITAKIDNTIFSSNLTYNGNFYSLLVPTDDSDISGKDGAETDDNISLFVIDIYSNSWVFTGPGHSRQLDLYINRPPVLDPITDITITEEETATINPSATDIDGDTITYSVNDTSRFTENSPPFNWVTDYDDAGVYIVRVTASDSEMIDYQDITVTVTNKNRAPVASATSTTTDEDTAKAITLSATDADDDSMTYSIVSAPSHGTLSGTIPELTYTPDENYNGADSFTFNANDGTVNSTAATISITVTAVNDAPTIDPEVTDIETPEDTVATLDLTQFENDVEDSDTFLTWTIGGVNTAIFTASIDKSTDVLTITPISDANGADTVTLTLTDSGDATATQDIIVTVTAVNDAPEASDGSALTDEDTAKAITLSATDADGNSLTYALVTNPTNGIVSISGATATYTPNTDYNGADSFTFNANDGTVNSTTATISITVDPVNDAPVAAAGSLTTAEDTATAITLNATDIESSPLTYSIVSAPTNGILTGTIPDLTYTPNADYNGGDSFTFKANDGTIDSNTATITITVTPVNDAPVAAAGSLTTAEDTATAITLNATDIESSPLTYSIVSAPTNGILTGTIPDLTYTPNTDYNGADSFTFNANDGTVNSTAATISITVDPVNDAPVAASESVTIAEDTATAITLNATDAEDDSLTYSIVSVPTHGTLSGTIPSLTYTPNTSYNGADSFTFNVNDGTVNSTTATILITVDPVNDAPQLDAITDISVFERQKIIIQPNATDVDEDSLTFSADNSNLTWNATSSAFEWTPDYLDSGNYTITITVSDSSLEDTKTFNIEVKDRYHAFDRELALGWNLISFPYVLDSSSIDDVLSNIDGNYNIVWAYNTSVEGDWPSYNPSMPVDSNLLKTLDNIQGFWINMTTSDRLTVIGTVASQTTIDLDKGWNLISYPFIDSAEMSCMLSEVAGNYTVVWQYNETAQVDDYLKWTLNNPDAPSQVNTLDNFTNGYGYWINMTEVETLEWTSTC